MTLRSVVVLGGGPGGLYVARLLKLRMPDCRVRLVEQSEPGRTFGFGVGLATRTQRNLEAADPATFRGILEQAWAHTMAMAVGDHRVTLPADNLIAIGRSQLLDILRDHAERAGVELEYGVRARVDDLDADLIVAADGVSSSTREDQAAVYGARVETHDSLYLWAGTDVALPSALFAPARTEHGTFVAHAYPYAPDRSTFLIETDEETWRRAGFDQTTEATPYDADDQRSLDYLSEAFAGHLGGHRLIGNRTRWLRFRTVTCERWHAGNVVLLGDAVHTAHYSIGSGTKLAMEDGIALVDALSVADDLPEALSAFEAGRRTAVAHLQETAQRSMRWWDSFATRLDLSVERLWVSYMTRAGKVTLRRFAATAPEVVGAALTQYAGEVPPATQPPDDIVSWVLSRPLVRADGDWARRSVRPTDVDDLLPLDVSVAHPWGEEATTVLKDVADRLGAGGRAGVLLRCDDDGASVLTMCDLGERLIREVGALVAVAMPASMRDIAAAALVSGRTDLVVLEER